MAYYKRNGFAPVHDQPVNTALYDNDRAANGVGGIVKYVKDDDAYRKPTPPSYDINKRQYANALECFKCLVYNLIVLSEKPEVACESFLAVSRTFDRLVASPVFDVLPHGFIYRPIILELQQKMHRLARENQQEQTITLRLSPERRAGLQDILRQMASIDDIKLNNVLL